MANIIINEFLTFVQNKIHDLDELSIIQICSSNFNDKEIEDGKSLLFTSVPGGARLISRKGEDKKKNNIRDVIKRLKETELTEQPTFVARDLDKLPPVSFDHVDVCRLLKDIAELKAEIHSIRSTCVSKTEIQEFQSNLHSEIAELRTSVNQAVTVVSNKDKSNESKNMSKRKQINKDSLDKLNKYGNIAAVNIGCDRTPTGSQASIATAAASDSAAPLVSDTYAGGDVTRRPSYRDITLTIPAARPTSDDYDNRSVIDDFTLVTKKRKSTKLRNTRGTLDYKGSRIEVAESFSSIYVSRFKKHTTVDDIKSYIEEMNESCTSVELLEQSKPTTFNSYKIIIPSSKVGRFLSGDFWPVGLVFRRYRERRGAPVETQPKQL